MSCPKHHEYLTESANTVKSALEKLESAAGLDASYKPLVEAARKLHTKLVKRWDKNVTKGNREGWFK